MRRAVREKFGSKNYTAFCISTDATGVRVQPLYDRAKGGQPCKKGHFLVMIADRDHILFDYLESENGTSIYKLFTGFSGQCAGGRQERVQPALRRRRRVPTQGA